MAGGSSAARMSNRGSSAQSSCRHNANQPTAHPVSAPSSTRASSSHSASRPGTQRASTKARGSIPRTTRHDASAHGRPNSTHNTQAVGPESSKHRRTVQLDKTGKQHTARMDASAGSGANTCRTTQASAGASRRTVKMHQTSCRRSTVKTNPFGAAHLYRVQFGDLLFEHDVASDALKEESKHERLIAFWRVSARSSQMQVPVNMVPADVGNIDYFVSHVWQPPATPQILDFEAYARQKTDALSQFCLARAALGAGDHNQEEGPWFLREPTQETEEENPADDPKHVWRNWQCWVDKACAVPPGNAEATPSSNELVRNTMIALRNSKRFLAVLTGQYFSRLWCVFEWAAFVARVTPHYRQIELVIPEACIGEGLWTQFIDTVSSFSLAGLHTGSESDHPQLWRELEQIVVSTEGFERFIQATALALLARYALLVCSKHCVAFFATITAHSQSHVEPLRLEPLVEACNTLGMHSLAAALHSAKPRGWWNLAYRRAKEKEKRNDKQAQQEAEKFYTTVEVESKEDPMERLWKAFAEKLKPKKDDSANQQNNVSDSVMAANYAMKMLAKHSEVQDAVLGSCGAVAEIKNRLSAKQLERSSALLQELGDAFSEDGNNIDKDSQDKNSADLGEDSASRKASSSGFGSDKEPEQDWLQELRHASQGSHAGITGKGSVSHLWAESHPDNIVGSSLSGILPSTERTSLLNERTSLLNERTSLLTAHANGGEAEVPKTVQDMKQDPAVAKGLFGGLPEGLGPFWRGLKGKPLSEDERVRAKVFRNAWLEYRQLVDKWFDKQICPKLEVWRQRGIRISSLLSETFGSSFLPVMGSLQDVLCDNLTPKAREMFLACEPPPRGRPARSFDAPWDNPALNRLILMGSERLDAERTSETKKAPVLLVSSLPLKMAPAPQHNLLCLRLVDSTEWKHVAVPQHLGAEALTNALWHLFEDKQVTKVELEVLVPRLALKVRGLEGFENMRVVLGAHAFGVLRHSRRRKATFFHKGQEVPETSMPISSITTAGSTSDVDDSDPFGWKQWKCSDTKLNDPDGSSESSDDGAFENLAMPGYNDCDILQTRRGYPIAEPAIAGVLRPLRILTPRRAGGDTKRGAAELAFEKAREKIMTFSKLEASGTRCSSPAMPNRRYQGAGGLLPEHAVLNPLRPPTSPSITMSNVRPNWQRQRPRSTERLPQIAYDTNARGKTAGHETMPRSARPQSVGANEHKDAQGQNLEATNLNSAHLPGQNLAMKQSWLWAINAYGGADLDNFSWSGTFRDIFAQVQKWMEEARVYQWMPIDNIAQAHGRGFGTNTEQHIRVQPGKKNCNLQLLAEPTSPRAQYLSSIAQGPCCSNCGHTDVVTVPLDRSILLHVWSAPACRVCLVCSNVDKVENKDNRPETFDEDDVLEVCTVVLLRSGTSSSFQQLAARVLRVDSDQVLVAAPSEDPAKAVTSAKSRVAHISLCGRSTGISAAVVTAKRMRGAPVDGTIFMRDCEWVWTCLRDSGLDLKYGEDRPVAIEQAIGELDDRRTLPRRVDISPLVLWVELRHILSENFDAFEWTRASQELLGQGKFSLPAAITMRQNTEKLRNALGIPIKEAAHLAENKQGDRGTQEVYDEPYVWPLTLHRAVFTEKGMVEELLGAALNGAGVHVGGPTELIEQGISLIAELHNDEQSGPSGTGGNETKAVSSAVKAAGAWRSSLLQHSRGSASKDGDVVEGKSSLKGTGQAVGFAGLLNAIDDDQAPRQLDKRGRRMTMNNIGRRALDPAAVMRNLSYRRNLRGGDLGAEARALLRARRLLRLMQVSAFLTKLHERVTANDEWRFSAALDDEGREQDSDSDDSSDNEAGEEEDEEDEEEDDDDDDDQGSKSSSTATAPKDPIKSVEELTVQKVLGHAKEYVHHADIIQKCLQVLNVIVQTCSTFVANAALLRSSRRHRQSSAGQKDEGPVPIERVALEQGFVRTALRAIYRHWKRPEIGAEALKMLVHITTGDLHEDICSRACAELSSPPERVMTLIIAAGQFSCFNHIDQLRSILKVLLAIVAAESAPQVPLDREEEAASTLKDILLEHEEDGELFEMSMHLVNSFLNNPLLCQAFFDQGLCAPIRDWLKSSANGEITELWRNMVEEETKDVKVGHSGIGAMHLRKKLDKINDVPVRVDRCDKHAWRIITKLTKGGSACATFRMESTLTIQHGVDEMRRMPRTSQWSLALACLAELVLNNIEGLAGLFIQAGGLELMLAEIPEGEVPNVLPIMVGLLTVEGLVDPPDQGPGDSDDEDDAKEVADAKQKQMERRDSKQEFREMRRNSRRMSKGEMLEGVPLLPDLAQMAANFAKTGSIKTIQQEVKDAREASGRDISNADKQKGLVRKVRAYFTKNQGVIKCLDALDKYRRWPELQTQLFSILAELFRGEELLVAPALKDFEHYKGILGGGLQDVFTSLSTHHSNEHVVDRGLCLLQHLMQLRSHIATRVADINLSSEILMQLVWKHLMDKDVRKRALTCARLVRQAVPSLVDNLADAWSREKEKWDEEQKNQSEDGSPAIKVPNDVKRFGGLLFIYRYALTNGMRPIAEAVMPLRDHTRDQEIVSIGLNAIMRGTDMILRDRFRALAEDGTFPAALNRILLLHPDADIVLLAVQTATGILQEAHTHELNNHMEEYASSAAMALSTMFEVTVEWTSQTWDAMLVGVEAVGRIEGGADILERYEVLECIEDEWDNLVDSDEEIARLITKSYHEETKRVITLLAG